MQYVQYIGQDDIAVVINSGYFGQPLLKQTDTLVCKQKFPDVDKNCFLLLGGPGVKKKRKKD